MPSQGIPGVFAPNRKLEGSLRRGATALPLTYVLFDILCGGPTPQRQSKASPLSQSTGQTGADGCSLQGLPQHPELTTAHQALPAPSRPQALGMEEQEGKQQFCVWCFECFFFFSFLTRKCSPMVQKLKQYKKAGAEKSVSSPSLSWSPHFSVSTGGPFFSLLGVPCAGVRGPVVTCSGLAVQYFVTLPSTTVTQ